MGDSSTRRIAVLGAGLIGLFVGGRLAAGGADVTFIGRPRILDTLRQHGLRLTDLDGGDDRLVPDSLTLAGDPAALADADLILLCVKSPATESAAADIARLAKPGAVVISLQNGVSNPDRLRAALPGRTVLAGMVPFNVAEPGPGHYHRGTSGLIAVQNHPQLQPFVPLFQAGGLPLHVADDMAPIQWAKLLINLNNAINALSGVPLAAQLAQRDYRRCFALCQSEGLRLLRRAGIEPARTGPLPPRLMPLVLSLPDRLFVAVSKRGGITKIDRHARSSMAEDLVAGRKTEVDYLNGEFVALARRLGQAAPVNARVIELVRAAEGGAKPWPAAALYAQLKSARRRG